LISNTHANTKNLQTRKPHQPQTPLRKFSKYKNDRIFENSYL